MNPHDDLELEPMPEGVEEAPPLTRTMAVVRWILFGGMCLFAVVMVLGYFGVTPWASDGAGGQQYHCPMHTTYISNQPGDCPICGMSLVPISGAGGASVDTSMDGDDAWMRETKAHHGQYGCPMDPEVVSDSAGRCPVCRMFLIQVDTTKLAVAAVKESNVPGLVPVMLAPQRLQLIGLKTAPVSRRVISDEVRLAGYVTPDETTLAEVQLRTSGWVQELYVNETGQRVEKGAPLLAIYSPELYQAWQDYQVARRAEQITSDTLMKAIKREVTEAAERRLRFLGLSELEIGQSATNGSLLVLRSPFTGHVLEKPVQAGQYVGPGQTLLAIADLRRVWIIAEVYERDLGRVRTGDSAHVTFNGESFAGTVSFVYPTLSPETRTVRVRIEVANTGLRLRPGMYADVRIAGGAEPALAVPADAVLDGGQTQYVFVVHEGSHFVPRRVTVGRRGDDYIEIRQGLSDGDIVVTSANFLIDSESRLQAAISGMGTVDSATTPPAHQH